MQLPTLCQYVTVPYNYMKSSVVIMLWKSDTSAQQNIMTLDVNEGDNPACCITMQDTGKVSTRLTADIEKRQKIIIIKKKRNSC